MYTVYQTWHKGHPVYRLRSTEPPYPSTYSTVPLALSVEAVQYCLTKVQDKLAAAGVSECAQRPAALRATLRLTEEWLQQVREPRARSLHCIKSSSHVWPTRCWCIRVHCLTESC
jgi:hypothetical protein